jgi:sporulation protein YlmC with PRC-barrel domain
MNKLSKLAGISLLALLTPLHLSAAERSYRQPLPINGELSGQRSAAQARADQGDLKSTTRDIKAFFIGNTDDDALDPILISPSMTARGLIGESIINNRGEKIASVHDIVIDKNGHPILVVTTDGGFLGIGSKVAAFDYNRVLSQQPDGRVVMTLSQDLIDQAADFSYDQNDWSKAKVIPKASYSSKALLKSNVFDNNGKRVANVENIYFRNAAPVQLIVGFNKKIGMGGDLAALNFDELTTIRKNQTVDFKLTARQSDQFARFRQNLIN